MKIKRKGKVCDYYNICKNKAYREVYPTIVNKKGEEFSWSYLCKKHLLEEQKRFKGKLSHAPVD